MPPLLAARTVTDRGTNRGRAGGLREWLYRKRDRLLADPTFQRRAARIPLVRSLAHRRAGQLHALTSGFVYSQVLFAGVRLGVLDALQDGPLSVEDLAVRIGLPTEGCTRLVLAMAGIGLLQRRTGDRYGLGELGAAMLGNPGVAAMVEHHAHLYDDLRDPVALLRERKPARLASYWRYDAQAAPGEQAVAERRAGAYSDLMAASQGFVANHVLDACSLRSAHHLLDVAGGDGSFAAAALGRWPQLRATVFDLPPVAALAGQRLAERGLDDRTTVVAGNMFEDALPEGADIISLVRVLHDHDDRPAMALLAATRAALTPGGRLLIAEPMADTPGAQAIGDTYFGMYLWAMGSGRPRTARELKTMAEAAGYRRCREVTSGMPMLVRVLVAET